METSIKGLLQNVWQPQLQFLRHKGKINITKPRPPHFKRAVMETLCVPYFEEKKRPSHIPNYDFCVGPMKKVQEKPVYNLMLHQKTDHLTRAFACGFYTLRKPFEIKDHPLELIMARESLNWFKNSKMIAFYHQNTLLPEEKFQNQLSAKKNGMKLFFFKNYILKKGLKGSIFESVMPLYEGPTATIFSPETNINALLKMSKKLQKLVLMAAIVDNRLLSYADLEHYGRFENIAEAQSDLLMSLNLMPLRFVQQITHHPNNLVVLLNEHKKVLKDGN